MDTGQARGHAGQINSGMSMIQGLIDEITDLIDGLFWTGEDKEHFTADWNGNLRPQAARVVTTLRTTADDLNRRADEQDQLSDRGN
jgi:uncharacterized protein YukE